MKPTFQLTNPRIRRDSFLSGRSGVHSLQTDYAFQSIDLGCFYGGGDGKGYPSFRRISDGYFRAEERQYFKAEAAFFALIIATVAVPVIQSIHTFFSLTFPNF
jgi:hypothetical protein